MKVCVPSLDDGRLDADVSPHFGRAPNYTVYDVDANAVEVHENDGKHHGGNQSPPQIVAATGADVLLCGNLGQKAVERFDAMDIDVYCGAEGTVREAIDQFEADDLEEALPGGDHCGGHGDQDHDHDH